MYLQLDTKFNPFTYDEMVKPLLYYKQAYDEAEAAYSALSSNTDIWRNRVNRDESPQAYEQLQRYSGDLTRSADDFSRGMTAKNRRALLGLKRRYASEIKPIEEAYNRRAALVEEQRKAELNNPTMLWQRRASEMNLDDFLSNPSLDYGKGFSGALLTQQVATKVAAFSKELRDTGKNGQKARHELQQILPYQYRYLEQRGFSSDEVLKAIAQDPDASKILTNIVDSTLQSSGIANWGDAAVMERARAYANEGLWGAVGQSEWKQITDQAGLTRLQKGQETTPQDGAGVKLWSFKNSSLSGEKHEASDQYSAFRDNKWINQKGQLTVKGTEALAKGSKIADWVHKYRHATTLKDKVYYSEMAYREMTGHDLGGAHPGLIHASGEAMWNIENDQRYQMYVQARKAGISRKSIVKGNGNYKERELSAFANASNIGLGNPVVDTFTHTLSNSQGKELYTAIASELGQANVYGFRIENNGNVVSDHKGFNLLKLNEGRDASNQVFVKHMSVVPSSPDKCVLILSNGQRVLLDRAAMNQAFGAETTKSIIKNATTLANGNPNEQILSINNLNELMGNATLQWGAPEAESTGLMGATWER